MLEALYLKYKTTEVYLSTSKAAGVPLWGDAAVFSILFDHIKTELLDEEKLAEYPCLDALYKAYGALPPVNKWVASKLK